MFLKIILFISSLLIFWVALPYLIALFAIGFIISLIVSFFKLFEETVYITLNDIGRVVSRRDGRRAVISHYDLDTDDKLCVWITTDEHSYLVDCMGRSRQPDFKTSGCDIMDFITEDMSTPVYQRSYWNVVDKGERGYIIYGKDKKPVSPEMHIEVANYIMELHNKSLEKNAHCFC